MERYEFTVKAKVCKVSDGETESKTVEELLKAHLVDIWRGKEYYIEVFNVNTGKHVGNIEICEPEVLEFKEV